MLERIKEHALSIRSTFIYSCRMGDIESVRKYLEDGYDCTIDDNGGIQRASENGHIEVVSLLIENGVNCTINNNYSIRTASYNGHFGVVRLL